MVEPDETSRCKKVLTIYDEAIISQLLTIRCFVTAREKSRACLAPERKCFPTAYIEKKIKLAP